jgi:hypothetical protein
MKKIEDMLFYFLKIWAHILKKWGTFYGSIMSPRNYLFKYFEFIVIAFDVRLKPKVTSEKKDFGISKWWKTLYGDDSVFQKVKQINNSLTLQFNCHKRRKLNRYVVQEKQTR